MFSSRRQRAPQRGGALVEACICIAVACVLAGVAAPGFTDLIRVKRLEAASTRLIADVYHARMRAVMRNEGVRITQGQLPDGRSCYVVHTGVASGCDCGRRASAVCDRAEDLIKVTEIEHLQVSLRTGSRSVLWYPTRSTITPTVTYRLALPDGRELHHIVNILGRTRTCSPNGAIRGHPAC